ncbi:hypothetical protein ZOSMA_19G00980 [Zostera marina]|uniref:Uncharacterized protein n=1 Tax=Zostera marina TaxID=29655 RepID=A0A0K9PQL1_ZOSMR|nr:hypothetical protein ZOSMA_19G00980 [Zostera marina]
MKHFPKKTMKELVSYYYNVHVCRRMVLQNQLKSMEIDSEDDEFDGKTVKSLKKTLGKKKKKRASKGKERKPTKKKKAKKNDVKLVFR